MKALVVQSEDELGDEEIRTLTKEEASELRKQLVMLSPWKVIWWQLLVSVAFAAAVGLVADRWSLVVSALYGSAAVVLPAMLFARGLMSRVSSLNPGAAVFGFFLWEMVKIALTVALLFAAPRLVTDLSWPVMLLALVVTMKVYWVALMVRPGRKTNV